MHKYPRYPHTEEKHRYRFKIYLYLRLTHTMRVPLTTLIVKDPDNASSNRLKTVVISSCKYQSLLCKDSYLQLVVSNGGARRDRTADLLRARQALSQLSYGPI
jgi:hypothetical protein